jgi:hypothetical protein
MHNTHLSKEGLQLLELLPVWQAKAALLPGAPARQRQGLPLLVVLPAMAEQEAKLWQQIKRALLAIHMDHQVLDQPLIIAKNEHDKLLVELSRLDPITVLVFGRPLAQVIGQEDPACAASATSATSTAAATAAAEQTAPPMVAIAGLQEMIDTPALKADAWQALCQLQRYLS